MPQKRSAKTLKKKNSAKKPAAPRKSAPRTEVARLNAEIVELKRKAMIAERMRFESLPTRKSQLSGEMLAAGIAHEFNNILGAIDGHADWALESNETADMKEALEITRLACTRSAQITRALQGLTQPREEGRDLIDMASTCADLERILHSYSMRFGVEFQVKVPRVLIYGSQGRILEVLVNLVKNAMEAGAGLPEPRWVRIDALVDDETVRLYVHDNGPGVPATLRKLIFQPFFTTKGVLKRIHKEEGIEAEAPESGEGGSGLGLFLARSFIEEHGGHLSLLADQPNEIAEIRPEKRPDRRGAIFEISLPRAREDD